MHQLLAFGIGMLARFVGMLAQEFARWLLRRIGDGHNGGWLAGIQQFWVEFLEMLAGRICGPVRYDEECSYAL